MVRSPSKYYMSKPSVNYFANKHIGDLSDNPVVKKRNKRRYRRLMKRYGVGHTDKQKNRKMTNALYKQTLNIANAKKRRFVHTKQQQQQQQQQQGGAQMISKGGGGSSGGGGGSYPQHSQQAAVPPPQRDDTLLKQILKELHKKDTPPHIQQPQRPHDADFTALREQGNEMLHKIHNYFTSIQPKEPPPQIPPNAVPHIVFSPTLYGSQAHSSPTVSPHTESKSEPQVHSNPVTTTSPHVHSQPVNTVDPQFAPHVETVPHFTPNITAAPNIAPQIAASPAFTPSVQTSPNFNPHTTVSPAPSIATHVAPEVSATPQIGTVGVNPQTGVTASPQAMPSVGATTVSPHASVTPSLAMTPKMATAMIPQTSMAITPQMGSTISPQTNVSAPMEVSMSGPHGDIPPEILKKAIDLMYQAHGSSVTPELIRQAIEIVMGTGGVQPQPPPQPPQPVQPQQPFPFGSSTMPRPATPPLHREGLYPDYSGMHPSARHPPEPMQVSGDYPPPQPPPGGTPGIGIAGQPGSRIPIGKQYPAPVHPISHIPTAARVRAHERLLNNPKKSPLSFNPTYAKDGSILQHIDPVMARNKEYDPMVTPLGKKKIQPMPYAWDPHGDIGPGSMYDIPAYGGLPTRGRQLPDDPRGQGPGQATGDPILAETESFKTILQELTGTIVEGPLQAYIERIFYEAEKEKQKLIEQHHGAAEAKRVAMEQQLDELSKESPTFMRKIQAQGITLNNFREALLQLAQQQEQLPKNLVTADQVKEELDRIREDIGQKKFITPDELQKQMAEVLARYQPQTPEATEQIAQHKASMESQMAHYQNQMKQMIQGYKAAEATHAQSMGNAVENVQPYIQEYMSQVKEQMLQEQKQREAAFQEQYRDEINKYKAEIAAIKAHPIQPPTSIQPIQAYAAPMMMHDLPIEARLPGAPPGAPAPPQQPPIQRVPVQAYTTAPPTTSNRSTSTMAEEARRQTIADESQRAALAAQASAARLERMHARAEPQMGIAEEARQQTLIDEAQRAALAKETPLPEETEVQKKIDAAKNRLQNSASNQQELESMLEEVKSRQYPSTLRAAQLRDQQGVENQMRINLKQTQPDDITNFLKEQTSITPSNINPTGVNITPINEKAKENVKSKLLNLDTATSSNINNSLKDRANRFHRAVDEVSNANPDRYNFPQHKELKNTPEGAVSSSTGAPGAVVPSPYQLSTMGGNEAAASADVTKFSHEKPLNFHNISQSEISSSTDPEFSTPPTSPPQLGARPKINLESSEAQPKAMPTTTKSIAKEVMKTKHIGTVPKEKYEEMSKAGRRISKAESTAKSKEEYLQKHRRYGGDNEPDEPGAATGGYSNPMGGQKEYQDPSEMEGKIMQTQIQEEDAPQEGQLIGEYGYGMKYIPKSTGKNSYKFQAAPSDDYRSSKASDILSGLYNAGKHKNIEIRMRHVHPKIHEAVVEQMANSKQKPGKLLKNVLRNVDKFYGHPNLSPVSQKHGEKLQQLMYDSKSVGAKHLFSNWANMQQHVPYRFDDNEEMFLENPTTASSNRQLQKMGLTSQHLKDMLDDNTYTSHHTAHYVVPFLLRQLADKLGSSHRELPSLYAETNRQPHDFLPHPFRKHTVFDVYNDKQAE
jgi:hypothetical protein